MEKGRIKELLKIHVALFLRRLWNYLLLFPIVAVAGVILVTDRGVPPDCLAKQWEWLSVSGMIACGTLVLIALFLPKKLNRLPRFVIWTLILLGGLFSRHYINGTRQWIGIPGGISYIFYWKKTHGRL